jgi:hypothetical protein
VGALNPFHNRPAEFELYLPLHGSTMLELGNKRNGPAIYKAYFQSLGFEHTSVDWNGEDGALKLDLQKPLGLGTFDMVSNIGTTEHVSDQEPVWRNILEAMHVGSTLVSTTPKKGNWQWHGEWYPTQEFYRQLAALNGLEIERLYVSGTPPREMWFCRARRVEDRLFVMPDQKLIYRNR